ncbi:DoxX family membrane protein [Acinetobacter baumannii]
MIGANLPLPELFAFATIAIQLIGSILLISNFAARINSTEAPQDNKPK